MKNRKILIMMLAVMMTAIFGQVCQGQEQPPKAVTLKSHDAEAILLKKAKKITQKQREEAAASRKEPGATTPTSPLKPVFETGQPIYERGRP
jgi:hypothetical protein